MNQRLMVFIDGSNLLRSSMHYLTGFRIDYIKLREFLATGKDLIRIYFFDALPDKNNTKNFDKKNQFLDFLRYNGYTVKVKPLKYQNLKDFDKPYQKGVDVLLVCEMIKMAKENAFDDAIIVSGDNDFASVIELVQDMGKNVEIAAFQKSIGKDVKQVCNKLILLDKFKGQFEFDERTRTKII